MREILFRGKRKDNGKWVEGFYTENSITYFSGTPVISDNVDDYKVERDTVGQYIGLKDKNGKKIFEGDILSQTNKHDEKPLIRVVKYEMSCGCCCTQVIGFGASGHFHLDFIRLDKPVEVIGNIHDNPELLEVER